MAHMDATDPSRPTDPRALLRQAIQRHSSGDVDGAMIGYQQFLKIQPEDPHALTNLAWAEASKGDSAVAMRRLQKVVTHSPGWVAAWNFLGILHQERRESVAAISCFRECIARNPAYPDAHFNLGKLLLGLRRLDEARAAFRAVQVAAPEHPEPLLGQSRASYFQGRMQEAMALALEARTRFPGYPKAQIEPVLLLNYDQFDLSADIGKAHLELGRWLVQQAGPQPGRSPLRPPGTRLRVGYVASNLHLHSNFRCVGPVIAAHDRNEVEVFVYHGGEVVDQATQQLMKAVEHWRDCRGKHPDEVAARMRQDGIDIAVGCEGLFHEFMPMVLARKPAPLQATWSGYPHALGLPTVDYRITDGLMDPAGQPEDSAFERPWRLPWFRSFLPPADAPDPGPLPASMAGAVTFISFNNLAKLGDRCLQLWGRVLAGLPGSTLRIAQVDPGRGREDFLRRLDHNGLEPSRVECLPYLNHRDYQEAHCAADLHLDSFPYPGVTVAANALWMGLPSICIGSAGAAGREGAAQLAAAGFPELIATDEDDYVSKYLAFARDLDGLRAFRAAARGRMAASHLLDPAGLARNLEGAYAAMARRSRPPDNA
jgi:predicted O-linked N-acetylglucosamine transferase (SPINDLY family)